MSAGLSRSIPELPVIFLMGPTATGKTDLAATLTERFPVELVSVDAAQVYRGMDIGTAKPAADYLRRYPHHLIDIRDPTDTYSAADFVADVTGLIEQIHARGKIPLLVGGTMFYFHALESGLSPLPSADAAIRKELERELASEGVEAMHQRLGAIDATLAQRIDSRDTQRIQRALEIHLLTGQPPSEVMRAAEGIGSKVIKLALFHPDRSLLHQRIERRYGEMLRQGLVREVAELVASMEDPEGVPALRTVGYRQVLRMLRGECNEAEMIASATAATRQLAKRQLTWLRQQRGVVWVGCEAPDIAQGAVEVYLDQAVFRRVD